MSDRLPPHSFEHEEGVLGCVLEAPERSLDLADERGLSPDWFYNPRCRAVWSVMQSLRKAGAAVDEVTLYDRLKGEKDAGDVLLFLSSLRDKTPSPENLPTYLKSLENYAHRRRLITICTEAAAAAYESEENLPAVLARVENELLVMREPQARRSEVHVKELMQQVVDDAENLVRGRGQMRGLPLGLYYLDDKILRGIRQDFYVVLAGRPGDGKTSLALNAVEHLALKYEHYVPTGATSEDGELVFEKKIGVPVGVFSLEMSGTSLGWRLACAHGGASEVAFATGYPTLDDMKNLQRGAAALSKSNIWLDCEPRQTIGAIRAKARRWARQHGIKLFVLDYLQLVRVDGRRFNDRRVDELTEISAEIMSLKKELQVPWLVLAQMNRNIEQAEAKRVPVLSDLKDCGAIEQDCDVAMFLYKPSRDMVKPKAGAPDQRDDFTIIKEVCADQEIPWDRQPTRINAMVAKHRFGPTGKADLLFQKNLCRFEDWHQWKVANKVEEIKKGEHSKAEFKQPTISDEDVPR